MLNKFIVPAVTLALSFSVNTVFAAEQHGGDVQPWKSGGQIFTNGNLFEADFGDIGSGPYKTDDPGFDADTAKGAFGPGNWLQFQGLGSLKFWNGTSWSNSVLDGEHIEIDDVLGNTTTFTTSGVTNPFGVIGDLGSTGDLHEHIDYSIRNSLNALGASVGAYWIDLQLLETAPNSTAPIAGANPSAPFSIIFNRGLASADFENAVAAVPVPGAVWLFGSALVGLVSAGRRRAIVSPI